MTDPMRAKFDELHPNKEGMNQSLRNSLYAIFKEGWENGEASSQNPPGGVTERRYGFYIPIIEVEADWGSKYDGYMVGFTIENLKERQKHFESGNSDSYGFYYKRPNEFTPVELTPEAIDALMKATDKNCTIWFDDAEKFAKGEDYE